MALLTEVPAGFDGFAEFIPTFPAANSNHIEMGRNCLTLDEVFNDRVGLEYTTAIENLGNPAGSKIKLAAQVELQNGETVWYDEPSDRSNFAMLTARSENKVAGTENPSVQFLTKQVFDANGTEQSLSRVKVGAFYTGAATMGEPVAMEDEIADGAFAANIASSTVWAGLGN